MQPVTIRRWEIAAAFVVLTIVFVGGLLWAKHFSEANQKLIVAQHNLSNQRIRDRRAADLKICRALNQVRAINNRDRALLVVSLRSTRAAIPKTTGFIHVLLKQSAVRTRDSIVARPYLAPVRCVNLAGKPK